MTNRTFTIIKPNAVGAKNIGNICAMIEKAGFNIIAMKMTCMSRADTAKFYAIHRGKPFFQRLCMFMTSGPLVAMVLEKDNAAADFRKLVGATDPAEAEEGTIRKLYAESKTRNSIHASDSDENAALEASYFFTYKEIFDIEYHLPVHESIIDGE